MIRMIDVPLAVWLVAPGLRYGYTGGQNGPFGDTLEAIRIETSAPEGEALLTERPSEAALVLAVVDACSAFPDAIDWANLPDTLPVTVDDSAIALNAVTTVRIPSGAGDRTVVLRDAQGVDSVSLLSDATFQFASDVAGRYEIHVFDRDALTHGVVIVDVGG